MTGTSMAPRGATRTPTGPIGSRRNPLMTICGTSNRASDEEKTMDDTITINDPELARMFEEFGAARMGDIPKWLHLGRTRDGRTREDFPSRRSRSWRAWSRSSVASRRA